MEEKELKEMIRQKFRNMQRFCLIAGISYHKLHNMFREADADKNAKNLQKIEDLYFNLNDTCLQGEIKDNTRSLIKTKIYSRYNNISDFCRTAGVTNTSITNIINGNTINITEITRKTCSILNIELNERTK